jgi:hypothetical protein
MFVTSVKWCLYTVESGDYITIEESTVLRKKNG